MTIMQLLGLDGDCLAEIFSVCTKSSLFALCCTSSRVNMLATPYLLRSVEIDGGVEEIASFLNLIITGNRRLLDPGTHVRTLKFTTGAFKAWLANKRLPPPMFNWRPQRPREFNWGLALTGALGLMPNLRSFEMQEGIGYLLSDQLAFTLMSRPRLRCLMLGGVGPSSADLLGQVMSLATPVSLRCLAIANGHIGMDNLDIAEGAGRVLVEARDNLIEPDDPIAAISSTAQVLFPHVTTLNISRCRILYNLLPKSFPALRILSICDSEVVTHTASPTDTTTTSDCHHVIFPGLYSLSGNLRHIRTILRPQRRYDALRRLDIHINPAEGPNTETYKTDHFLSLLPTMPNLNSLHIWLCKYNDSQSWHNLVNQCSHLTFLHVGAHPLAPPSTSFKFMSLGISTIISVLPLKFLSLTLPIPQVHWWDSDPLALTDHSIARSFGREVPTLKYFQITRCQRGQVERTWWRIHEKTTALMGGGQEVSGDASVRVTMITEEDGLNARDCFDWEWRGAF